MLLNIMDCSAGRSTNIERESEVGDDLSDDEMRDCESMDGDHVATSRTTGRRLNTSNTSSAAAMVGAADMSYIGVSTDARSPHNHHNTADLQMGHHHHQFPPNHPLNALGNFMGIGGIHGIPSLQHNDVLEKLKMQVRDMKVGLMQEQDYAHAAAAFGANVLPTPMNSAFTLPPTSTMASYAHSAQNSVTAVNGARAGEGSVGSASSNANTQNSTNNSTSAATALTNGNGSFSFASPTAPGSKDANPASNSSTSSEASNSSQQNNSWSFEEQYKQVRQLYEINDDPKRKEFLDDLFSFMQKRGTPINRLPIMAKSVLDLYELYNLVIARGGLVDVINKKLWQEIIKGLHLPSSITSAAFTLRTQYMKYLYPYECEKKSLSSPAELQAAIDGNRREGRRSSYGQYETMHNSMQMPQISRQGLPAGMQQMSPLALVTHAAAANNQQAQAAAAAAVAHHRLMAPTFGQMPNLVSQEFEQRMMEYIKMITIKKEGVLAGGPSGGVLTSPHHQQQQQCARASSPEMAREALNAFGMSRVALWQQMYQNSTSPPASMNASPQGSNGGHLVGGEGTNAEPQRSEALNLSDLPAQLNTAIKREREREPSTERCGEHDDFHQQPPPTKRLGVAAGMTAGFPASFYLPHGMAAAAAAAAANFRQEALESDAEERDDDDVDADAEHNTTGNSFTNADVDEEMTREQQQVANGHHQHHQLHNLHHQHQQQQQHKRNHQQQQQLHSSGSNSSVGQHDKSDDSAIENSPSTSGSAGNGHISPVSTKKIHLTKQQTDMSAAVVGVTETGAQMANALESLNLLSGLQFCVQRNGEQQLVVNLELNGIKYSGILKAHQQATAAMTTSNNNSKDTSKNTSNGGSHKSRQKSKNCSKNAEKVEEMNNSSVEQLNDSEMTEQHEIAAAHFSEDDNQDDEEHEEHEAEVEHKSLVNTEALTPTKTNSNNMSNGSINAAVAAAAAAIQASKDCLLTTSATTATTTA